MYFPTTHSTEDEIDLMYGKLEELLNITEEKFNVFIIGEFIASVREQILTSIHLGRYGFGNQNDRSAHSWIFEYKRK